MLLMSVGVLCATTAACALTPPMLMLIYWQLGWIGPFIELETVFRSKMNKKQRTEVNVS